MQFEAITPLKVTPKEEIFHRGFNPKEYLQLNYSPFAKPEKVLVAVESIQEKYKEGQIVNARDLAHEFGISLLEAEDVAVLDFQRFVAKELLDIYPEDNISVLDVGGGPTVYQHIMMSLQAGNITHLEFLEQNRDEVNLWIRGEGGSHNWDSYFELVQKLLQNDGVYQKSLQLQTESKNEKIAQHSQVVKDVVSGSLDNFKLYLRQRLVDRVIYGNVFTPGLELNNDEQYDGVQSSKEGSVELLTSNFTIESATTDKNEWKEGVKNICAQIKPGGFLSITAIRNAKWYLAGGEKMPSVAINENDLAQALEEQGLEVQTLRVLEGLDINALGYDGLVLAFARKKK